MRYAFYLFLACWGPDIWRAVSRRPCHGIRISLGAMRVPTDAGAASLGSGIAAFSQAAVKRDLRLAMLAARSRGIPFLTGSAGMAGADLNLAWVVDIVKEIAREERPSLHYGDNPRGAGQGIPEEKAARREDPAPQAGTARTAKRSSIGVYTSSA